MTQILIGDLRTGRILLDFPFSTESWTLTRNAAGTIRARTQMTSRFVQKLDLQNITTVAKTYMCVVENDVPLEAGPIWNRSYNKATGALDLTAGGLWTYFDHRQILPLLTDTQTVLDPATGDSATWANTDITLASYGLIAKKLIQQSMLWTGGNLPITFAVDEPGTFERHYLGATLTKVGEALRNLVDLVDGVDIRFMPKRTTDRLGIRWELQTGTLLDPYLHNLTPAVWDYSVPKPSIRNLIATDDGSSMTGQAWASGGRQDGIALVERAIDPTLVNSGYPLLESVDASHVDVVESPTLVKYARNAVMLGRAPNNAWNFEVKADGSPALGSYFPGDPVTLKFKGDPWISDGPHTREIAQMSSNEAAQWVQIVSQETINA